LKQRTENPRIASSTSQCAGQGKRLAKAKEKKETAGWEKGGAHVPLFLPEEDCPEHDLANRFHVIVEDVLTVARYLGFEKLRNISVTKFLQLLKGEYGDE